MESVLIADDGFVDHSRRDFALVPADDFHTPALEVFVDMKEVLHFLQIVL
jgi:hypothetical protein